MRDGGAPGSRVFYPCTEILYIVMHIVHIGSDVLRKVVTIHYLCLLIGSSVVNCLIYFLALIYFVVLC